MSHVVMYQLSKSFNSENWYDTLPRAKGFRQSWNSHSTCRRNLVIIANMAFLIVLHFSHRTGWRRQAQKNVTCSPIELSTHEVKQHFTSGFSMLHSGWGALEEQSLITFVLRVMFSIAVLNSLFVLTKEPFVLTSFYKLLSVIDYCDPL